MSLFRKADPRRGAAAVEFALILPMLLMLFIGTGEAMAYLRAAHRLERTAAELANTGSQLAAMDQAQVSGLFTAANLIADPVRAWTTGTPAGARSRTVISVVNGTPTGNSMGWSCAKGDSGLTPRLVNASAPAASRVTLPNGFAVPAGQTVLVVEIISTVQAWVLMDSLFTITGMPQLRTHAIVRPRQAQLSTVAGGCPA
jgi:hypothetical protein